MVSVSSDWLYTQNGIEEIVMAMKANDVNVKYAKINSEKGHDAFLIENGQLSYIVKNFLSKTRVKDLMSYEHVVIRENQDIKKAAEVMLKQNKTHIPIVNDDCEIKGIITAWDLSKSIATGTDNIDEIMTKQVISCYENDLIRDVADKMKINNISALPVIDKNNKVIGSITTRHLSSLLSE
jgi:homoserine O-acetyltransferase